MRSAWGCSAPRLGTGEWELKGAAAHQLTVRVAVRAVMSQRYSVYVPSPCTSGAKADGTSTSRRISSSAALMRTRG